VTGGFYREKDIPPGSLKGKCVGVVGFGNQGRAQALNLRDSGVQVVVALREGSSSREEVVREGIVSITPEEIADTADVISLLIPDEVIGSFFRKYLGDVLKPGQAVCFAHGFAYHYEQARAPDGVDVILVAPLGPGRTLRESYLSGGGLPAYAAVGRDASGHALDLALSYGRAIGCAKVGIWVTTFAEETEVDLFGEQAVLCGGLAALVTRAFEVLTEAGYSPEIAYLECVHQLEQLARLISTEGPDGMRRRISGTALYGELTRGPGILGDESRRRMKEALEDIRSGRFAREWLKESESGRRRLRDLRKAADKHPVAEAGRAVRKLLEGD
jgi:ketol-acid reductoisomerase